jgi:polysaccharide biosynthesis transport protein
MVWSDRLLRPPGPSEKGKTVDLRQIVRRVRANWIVALVTFLACVGIGFLYAVIPAKHYEASVVLLAQPPPNTGDAGALVGAIQIEIPQIVVEAENGVIDSEARAAVPARYRDVPVTISAVGDPGSNSVTISATSTDPAAAQAYANATAARVVKVSNHDDTSVLVLTQLGSAPLPTTATNPKTTVAVAAIAFGLIAAVFAALGAAALRRGGGADELSERFDLPILGEVPSLGRASLYPGDMFDARGSDGVLEAFQQLRSYLHIMFQDANPVIAFTSCEPKEGKSTVASRTAWVLATPGRFVVAVDADLRQPRLQDLFGVSLSPGVSDIPTANGPSELLASTENRYLEVIPAGVATRHPVDVAAADMPRLLRALRESDRTVVLDCPPVAGMAETTILVAKADAVVLVVDARKLNFDVIDQGLAQLHASGANVVGIVLNRVRRAKTSAGYHYSPAPPVVTEQKLTVKARSAMVRLRGLPRSG